jgi:DNA-binding transcriptional ArsR family regulator
MWRNDKVDAMREILSIAGALADEGRVRALLALRGGELCVCQIVELLRLAPSTVSKHLSVLRQAGLVEARKQSRWMYYQIPRKPDAPVRRALDWVFEATRGQPETVQDQRRLKVILEEDPEELCRRQMGRSKCCSSAPATPAAARWPKVGRGS